MSTVLITLESARANNALIKIIQMSNFLWKLSDNEIELATLLLEKRLQLAEDGLAVKFIPSFLLSTESRAQYGTTLGIGSKQYLGYLIKSLKDKKFLTKFSDIDMSVIPTSISLTYDRN